jgi:hypothetical protein
MSNYDNEDFLKVLQNNKYQVSGHDLLSYLIVVRNHPEKICVGFLFEYHMIVEGYVFLLPCTEPGMLLKINLKGLWFIHCANKFKKPFLNKICYQYGKTNIFK